MITPRDILSSASAIYDNVKSKNYTKSELELKHRNCARMAYYSILHLSKDLIDESCVNIDTSGISGTHEIVIRKLLAINSDLSNSLAQDLISCRVIRVKADYYLHKNFSANDAYKVLRKAEKAFNLFEEKFSTGT
ncbi:hypothetical protein ACK4QF_20890 [Proteus mirabilis]|uniref:HEPN domain-containing protein n=1 Tax=Proteus mirabilis TaxID=584 RepID=A0A7D5W604_PROMI|nr:hypothetical protein [Proteus mirabilis]QLJ18348.1 hypothetical protein HZ283_15030 [Proteus mirabilis]HDA9904566.1 hypothetical protein [Proteus mirabilis]HEH4198472.1 hypothetical protein [Proteus mirabilis]HEH4213007.1 hypothetical protein [Proteus mirabilis]